MIITPGEPMTNARGIFIKEMVFAPLPLWLMRREEISHLAKLVYGLLLHHAGKGDHAWGHQEDLAAEIGSNYRSFQRAIAELVEYRLIAVERPRLKASNDYRILQHEWMTCRDGFAQSNKALTANNAGNLR